MRNSKKFLTLVLAVLMVMSTVAFSTSAATFTDVKIDTKALYQATGLLSDLGVTKGTTATTFSPADPVTREQMAAFTYRLMKAGKSQEGGTNSTSFTDLTDPTFYSMVSWANQNGVIKGRSATTFDPKGGITLQDAYTMVVRALGYEKKEAVSYPYGFIDQAETLGLDKNLPSSLKYTDFLTRGDVAIILYNAFFADMAEGETTTIGTIVGDTIISTPITVYPTVAEKIFNVKKDTQRVVATPNYYLDDAEINTDNFDTDVLQFNGTAGYRTFEELGLTGKADDYFLSDFTLYLKDVTLDDGSIETQVLYAEPLLTKKTVSKATVGKVNPLKGSDYYNEGTKSYTKASGLLTIDGVKAYLYNAPYSYTKPQITSAITNDAAAYYEVLNKKDVEFIGLASETKEGVSHFETSTNADQEIFGLPQKTLKGTKNNGDEVYSYDASVFTSSLNQIYNEGYYELDTYDSNSDGIIDYIWYKPYTFGQAIKDEDYTTLNMHAANTTGAYSAVVTDNVPTIYTYEATVAGATFKDKDFVVAYVNGPANYIKVAAVVEKTSAEIKSYNSANWNIVLKNGTTMSTYGTSKMLVNFGSGDAEQGTVNDPGAAFASLNSFGTLYAAANLGEDKEFYVYGGRLLYNDEISNPTYNKNDLVIIPQEDFTKWGTTMSNNYLTRIPALTAYVSGSGNKNVLIPVEVENNIPETLYSSINDNYDFSAFKNQICTYTVDADSVYSLVKAINTDNTGALAETAMASTDADAQYGISGGTAEGVVLKKVTGTTYQFIDPTIPSTQDQNAGILPNNGRYVKITDYSKVIIKSKSETNGEYIFTEFGASKLPNIDNALTNVQIILMNNPSSTQSEYIAVLYAEIDAILDNGSIKGDSNQDIRIVKTSGTIDVDASGNYHNYYEVYNPFTGAIETGVQGYASAVKASNLTSPATVGKFYEVAGGILQDKNTPWYANVAFPSSGTLTRVPATVNNPTKAPANLALIKGYDNGVLELSGTVTDFTGNVENTIFKTDSQTKVVMIEAGGTNKNDFKWGTTSPKTLADLGSESVSLRNYFVSTDPQTERITTLYADNIEAYVTLDSNKSLAGQYETVDFVVILRDKVSAENLLNGYEVPQA